MKMPKGLSILTFSVAAAILIIALSVAYYFVIFLPGKESAKKEVFMDCDTEAKETAKDLLQKKGEIGAGPSNWKEAFDKGLYLTDDYNKLYESCLRRHGFKY